MLRKIKISLFLLSWVISLGVSSATQAELIQDKGKFTLESEVNLPKLFRHLDRHIDQSLNQLERLLDPTNLALSKAETAKLSIKIYANHQNLLKNAPKNIAKNLSSVGFFSLQDRSISVWYGGSEEETLQAIRHELIHYALHQKMDTHLPVWFDEGLAELLSRNPQVLSGSNSQHLPDIMKVILSQAKEEGIELELSQLFQRNHQQFYKTRPQLDYSLSYALVSYLIHYRGIAGLQQALNQGENLNRWFVEHLARGNIKSLERELMNWVL